MKITNTTLKISNFSRNLPNNPPLPPDAGADVVELENNPPVLGWEVEVEPNNPVPAGLAALDAPKLPPKALVLFCCPGWAPIGKFTLPCLF